jgi:hypothetical protein
MFVKTLRVILDTILRITGWIFLGYVQTASQDKEIEVMQLEWEWRSGGMVP